MWLKEDEHLKMMKENEDAEAEARSSASIGTERGTVFVMSDFFPPILQLLSSLRSFAMWSSGQGTLEELP